MRNGPVLLAAFSAAVFAAVYLVPSELWLALGLLCLLPLGLCVWRRRRLCAWACLGVAAALLWCGVFRGLTLVPAQELDGRRARVTVTIRERPAQTDYGAKALCYVLCPGRLPVSALLLGDDALLDCGAGDRLTLTADCTATAFSQTKAAGTLASRGVFLSLTARSGMTVEKAERPPWWALPRWFGQALASAVGEAFPGDVSGLAAALVAGDRSGIDDGLWTDLERTGMSHLVSVSGMHVCFLLNALAPITGKHPRRRALVGIPAVLLFALAVGATPSVLRACVFQIFLLSAPLLGREADPWATLLAALALLLTADPLSARHMGLQLSFSAVAGIRLVSPRLLDRWRERVRRRGPKNSHVRRVIACLLVQPLSATLGALVFTTPLLMYYTGSVSLVSPLSNLLTLPVVSVFFAGSLLAGLTALALPAAGAWLGGLLAPLGRYVLGVVRLLAGLPYSGVRVEDIYYPGFLLSAYALLLIAVLWRGQRRRWWVFVTAGALVLAGAVLFTRLTFRFTPFTATVLDVGQGQSLILSSEGETALIDCGGSGRTDPGDVAADYLMDRGERCLDKLILTHYHADHTNGLDALFRRLEIEEVILPAMEHDEDTQCHILELVRREGAAVTWLEEDTGLSLGTATLTLYAPLGDGGANEEGLSVLASAGDFHLLVTGDMNTNVEERLVKYGRLPRCQVLVAGHHGSRYASGDALLNAIRPQTVLISVGENTYGHPAGETLDRLARYGAQVYRTDLQGALTVSVTP